MKKWDTNDIIDPARMNLQLSKFPGHATTRKWINSQKVKQNRSNIKNELINKRILHKIWLDLCITDYFTEGSNIS